MTQIQIF